MRFAADTVVVITGSNRGLGFQFAKQLLETTPSTVVATARNPSNADQLNELKQHHGKRLQLISMDTSDEGSVQVPVLAELPVLCPAAPALRGLTHKKA